jgi:hypothetical protein
MGRIRTSLVFVALVAVLALPQAHASSQLSWCSGSQLTGDFTRIAGSAAAGSVSYRLVLRNTSSRECAVTGLPLGRLLDGYGRSLPTHVRAAFPGALTAVLVRLAPDAVTRATARFSPDVPGPGEPFKRGSRQCEPVAHFFRVTGQGGGTTTVRLNPVTPVCEHGALRFSAYSR